MHAQQIICVQCLCVKYMPVWQGWEMHMSLYTFVHVYHASMCMGTSVCFMLCPHILAVRIYCHPGSLELTPVPYQRTTVPHLGWWWQQGQQEARPVGKDYAMSRKAH